MRHTQRDPERHLRWGIFLAVVGFYLLTASRERPWSIGELHFEVARALVERRSVEVTWAWYPYSHAGADGGQYSTFPLLPSLAQVPGVLVLAALGPQRYLFALPLITQLAPAAFAALTCVLFYSLSRHLGVSRRSAATATAILALATPMWVYARRPYGETIEAATVLAFVTACLGLRDRATVGAALLVGLSGGLCILANLDLSLGVVAAVLVLFARSVPLRAFPWLVAGMAPFAALLMAYNQARWGNPFDSGMEPFYGIPREQIGWGLWGLLASPGKSLLLYAPPVLLGLIGWPRLARIRPGAAAILAATVVPPMLQAARDPAWSGGWCWGPRLWVFSLPVLLLGLGTWLDVPRSGARKRLVWGLVATMGLSGMAVQVVGNAYYWDHYIRLAKRVQRAWLGRPSRRGTVFFRKGPEECDPCQEDMYGLLWHPAFQPIVGHAWMLRHTLAGSPHPVALADAPWSRYTTLEIDLGSALKRERLDWWGFAWIRDFPERTSTGIQLLCVFILTFGAGTGLGLRGLTGSHRPPPPSRPPRNT